MILFVASVNAKVLQTAYKFSVGWGLNQNFWLSNNSSTSFCKSISKKLLLTWSYRHCWFTYLWLEYLISTSAGSDLIRYQVLVIGVWINSRCIDSYTYDKDLISDQILLRDVLPLSDYLIPGRSAQKRGMAKKVSKKCALKLKLCSGTSPAHSVKKTCWSGLLNIVWLSGQCGIKQMVRGLSSSLELKASLQLMSSHISGQSTLRPGFQSKA